MSDVKTLQVCHCGWTSVTTYHGLRTHQGKKGCTPKKSVANPGHTKPDAAQIIINTFIPRFTNTLPPFDQQGLMHLDLDENMVIPRHLLDALENNQTQSRLMFPTSKPLQVESPQMFHSQTEHKDETRLPAAAMWQTQPMLFGPQQTPALADLTVRNVPLFGSAQQPLQPPDHVNKTHSALDSIVGAQQFAKPTSSSQTSTANTAATNERENTTLFQSPPQPSQPVLSRTQMFGQTSGPQANSNWSNVVTEIKGTQQSQPLFTGAPSQTTFSFNSKQTFIKPASFTPQHIASNSGDESMDQNFGTALPNCLMFGDRQSQSVFGAQQFQFTKTEPPNAQTTAANNTPPKEMPGSSLLKGLLVSDGALQQPSANPVAAQENNPIFGSAQQPLQPPDHVNKTHSALDSIVGAQQFSKPTSSSQTSTANTAATNEKENTTLFQSPPQPSQPALSRTQMFGQTSGPQANSNWSNVVTEIKGTQQSQPLFTGATSQTTFSFNSKQQTFIKPASFTPQHIASNTGDESMDQNFGTTLPNSVMFGDRQSQSVFGAQQFQMTKTEPPNAQTTAANNTPPMEMPGSSLLKGLLVSDVALQQPSANPVAAQENKPMFGSAQQPLQTSEFSSGQQFAKPTSSSQTSTANTSATNENKPLFPSPQQPSQPVLMFGQTSAPQANSNRPNVATETKEETQQYFGTTLPNFSLFGDKQSQSSFGWPTSAQQFQFTKTEPPNAQTTAANNTPPMEKPGSSLSDGALQQLSLGANPVVAKEKQSNIASPQSQSPSFSAQSVTSTTGAQQPFYQISTTQPRPEASEGALKEHKPVSSSRPPPSTQPTGAPQVSPPSKSHSHGLNPKQTGSVKEEQSGPVTPKTVPQKENEQFFETPKLSHQSAPEGNKTRRALDFSTGAQQAQTSMSIPTTTSQVMLPPVLDTKEIEKLRQIQRSQMKAELQQIIRSRVHKLSEIRSHVKACKGSLDEEWLEINTVFSDVIQVVEEARQRALQPLENRKEKLKKESQRLIKTIEEDIEKLERAIGEVDTAADLDAVPLSKLKIKDFSKRTVDTSFSFGTLQQTVSAMMEQVKEELEKLAALELERAPAFAVDVKLDRTTAHQWLAVSKDGKKVQDDGQIQQQLPLAFGRFDMFGSILGANELRSGRAYWEVQVGGKTGWDLGVASAKANRKGKLTLSPDKGYWAIVHYEGENYAALASPPVCLQLKEKPQKVGVFLDFEEGLVSFYDVTNQSHIYSFTKCSFNDSIFPYFSPHLKQNGKNSEPLVITAVKN